MLFYSATFMLFFIVVLILTCWVPVKWKNGCLLLASYLFYASWGLEGCVVLLGVTVVTYFSAIFWEREKAGAIFLGSVCLLLGTLAVFKYADFLTNDICRLLRLPVMELGLFQCVGISFFILQALGYLTDVRRGKYSAERNFWNLALFISFFPQLLSGPIGRGDELLPQYRAPKKPEWDNFRRGIMKMLWGYFLKLVIADRAGILVDEVYGNYESFPGICVIFATLVYGVEIYCDFSGYSYMAIGAAEILGIHLPENFKTPYFSKTIQEFWRRWHISLSSWFRDYLYIPLGGNRKGKWRTKFNLMLVFLTSGLWHGTGWNFLLWGGLHGIYQIVGRWSHPIRQKMLRRFGVRTQTESYRLFQMLVTFLLVDFAWLFFRAESITQAVEMLRHTVWNLNPMYLVGENWYSMGLNRPNFQLLLVAMLVLMIADVLKYRNISVLQWYFRQGGLFRCICDTVMILIILLFGVWGSAYNAASFIYFQF